MRARWVGSILQLDARLPPGASHIAHIAGLVAIEEPTTIDGARRSGRCRAAAGPTRGRLAGFQRLTPAGVEVAIAADVGNVLELPACDSGAQAAEMLRSSSCRTTCRTVCSWKRGRATSTARVKCQCVTWCATRFVCDRPEL